MSGGRALLQLPEGNLRMKPGGAARNSPAVANVPLLGRVNYFLGSDRSRWRKNIPTYAAVKFEQVYPGIDLVYHGRNGRLEYDFIVAPGADPGAISLEFEGADRIELDQAGNLFLSLPRGTVEHHKPAIYQMSGGRRRELAGRYVLTRRRGVRFEIGDYDRWSPLIIDPVLSYSTYVGGSEDDAAYSIAVDSRGNVYIAGMTVSTDFPQTRDPAPPRECTACTDAFVAKLSADGSSLLYAAYLGGAENDLAYALAVDREGNAYVAGGTTSRNFPITAGAFQPTYGGTGGSSLPPLFTPAGDAFVAKLDPTGSVLVYSSYLGGRGKDQAYGIAVDSAGTVTVAGTTSSGDFPLTEGALRPSRRAVTDGFIVRVDPTGTRLVYSALLGGSLENDRENYLLALAVDPSGSAYVTGITDAPDFPTTPGAFDTSPSFSTRAFVAKLNITATALIYSTFLGGNRTTEAYGIAIDAGGSAYVTGATNSLDFPTTPGTFRTPGVGLRTWNAFVTKLNPAGSSLIYSNVFGGSGGDVGLAIAVDQAGHAYIAGGTAADVYRVASDFPTTPDAVQPCAMASGSAFLVKINADGTALEYASFLGGRFDDSGTTPAGIALDASGRIYLAGFTDAPDFPVTAGAFQTVLTPSSHYSFSGGDAFVTKVDLSAPAPMGISCVANAASLEPHYVAPGEIVRVFGAGIGPSSGVTASPDADGRFSKALVGVRVLFDGVAAPLLYVRSDRIDAVVPFGLSAKTTDQPPFYGTADVQIEYEGKLSNVVTVRVGGSAFGIFTADGSGTGQAAALNEDGSENSPSSPASIGSVVTLFGTGLADLLKSFPEDGSILQDATPITVTYFYDVAEVGCRPADVLYLGTAPGRVAGTIRIDLRIPDVSDCGGPPFPVRFLGGSDAVTLSVR
jgi:uncharacterized protein (TIGR03437 family)